MQDRLLKQARHEFSPKQRGMALLLEGLVFLITLPAALILLSAVIDRWLRFPRLIFQPANLILGLLMVLGGGALAVWTIYVQFTIGRGTPVPVMATQKLIVQPPYTLCRNPMVLGTIIGYLGVAVLLGSISAALLVLFGAACLLTYVKLLEEKEMVLRFGQEYLDYRRATPFLIPRLRR